MDRSQPRWLRADAWRSFLVLAGLPLLGCGCAQFPPSAALTQPPAVRAAEPEEPPGPPVVPVSLDTVFRLAEEQNPQIALARERVNEAYAEKQIAAARWVPDVYVGTAYYRHEGGIQSFQGPLINSSTGALFAGTEIYSNVNLRDYAYQKVNAQRQLWQQKGALSKVTSETLLEAADAYLDLLTALSGIAIAAGLEKDLQDLLSRANALASKEPGARVEAIRIRSELDERRQALAHVRQQAEAAAAKLAYLLGIDPCSDVCPVDRKIMPLELVDASPPACELVAQALRTGPGVQEMESLLALIQEGLAKSQGASRYIPILGVRMAEGAFGAGAGDSMTWANRFDLGLQARWNLTEYVALRERRRAAQSRVQQAHLAYKELRNKLTAGVQEARSAIIYGREQVRLGEQQIRDARQARDLSDERLKNNAPGSSYSEVLLALGSVAKAQLNYLLALSAYDKAQVRLLVLLGPGAARGTP